jgi:hypothetical protein
MKTFHIAGMLFAAALAVAGCSPAAENKAAPAAENEAAPAAPAEGNAAEGEGEGEAAAPAAGQANQNFTVVNNTGHTVMTLNVSPSNENSWGPDILGSNVLANGQSGQVTFPRGEEQCSWDIRATYDDGDTTDVRGVNLCQVATVTLTASE